MERKQFTFYRSIYDSAQDMPDLMERLGLYEAVIEFALFEKEPVGLSAWQRSLFKSIRPNLEASIAKAKMGAKGKRGPAKKKNNESENEKENENEIEIEKENEIEIELEIEDECPAGDGFTEFWKKYPLKLGKKEARAVWLSSVRDPQAVLKGVDKWKRSAQWNRENGRFVPRAAKFLADGDYRVDPPGYVPTGGTGELGQAELEAIARIMES